ncbi:PAS domain S-box protein [Algibacter sp. TI.3.09]|uniref:PAS domain S-box protein n=1 Tax=Algibacter sp. TI.3.09 TaxID=3121298 RepID=UPI00311EECD3
MEKLEKSIKKRYLLFVSSIIIITLTTLFIVQSSISSQILDSKLISVAGKQRVLAQRISKIAFSIGYDDKQEANINLLDNLSNVTKKWDSLQAYQQAINNKKENSETVAVLLEKNKSYLNKLSASGKNVIGQSDFEVLKAEFKNIAEVERPYFENIDSLISEYQKKEEKSLKTLKVVIYSLAIGTFLLLLGGFLTVIRPAFKKFLSSIREIKSSNEELSASKAEIKSNLCELTKLKTDLELKDANNKIFIEQAPTAIAMLDTNMCYIAASKKWILDYKMENQDIVGRCHYDLFPEIGDEWKANHQKCLNGAIDVCDEAPFVRLDGTVQWIYWDVRPWYISEGIVGGLIMHTGDITHIKEKEDEKKRIENILDKTSQIARIGTWEIDLIKNNVFWSKVLHEIHEVPEDYEPNLESAIKFFKEGISRNAIEKAINDSKEQGTPFDLELELITAKGKAIWTRAIGQAEFIGVECTRVFGVFQDINKIKSAELALHKAHTELKAIFNSKALAIVSTDNEGLITHFNCGAEDFLGYSAAEMIGKVQPNVFYLEEELVNFRRDMANKYEREFENYDSYRDLGKEDTFDIREWTFVRKDGTTFPVESTLTTIKDEQGNNVGFLGVSTDISGRKIAEKELIRKNQLLNYAEKITLMGNWRWDVHKNTIWLSDGMYEIYEIDDKEGVISFENLVRFVHPEDKGNVEKHAKATIENKVFENDFISRIVTAKGETKILRLLGEVKTNNLGEVIEVIGTTQDITEQKMAEAELLLKNKFLSFAERITKMGNWQWNLVTGALQWSDNMHEIYASDKNQIDLSYETFMSFVHPEDKTMVAKFVADALVEKKLPNNFIHRIITSDGELKTIHTLGEVIFDNHGEILEMIGTTQDITEQKMAEAELLRKNHFLSFAERITKMGNWQWCVITDSLKWSSNLYGIFEHDVTDENLNYNTFFSYVHPDDKAFITRFIEDAFLEKKFPDNFIHRIVTSKGKIKTVHFLGEVILDDQGEIFEMIGTCQDVTEQKMEENKFRGLLESAPDAMVITDEASKIQMINKQAEKMFGYKIEELYNKSVDLLLPKRFLTGCEAKVDTLLGDLVGTESSGEEDLAAMNKEGKEFPVQITLSPLETEDGVLVSAAIRDVTDQKTAQNKIIRAKNDLEILAQKLIKNNNQLADFAHITSHNLRAPVSNLNSLLGLYNASVSEDDKAFLFEKFEKVINHLTVTLNTLVDAVKIKNNTPKEFEKLKFNDVLNKTKEILTGQIMKNEAIITSDFSEISKIKYDRIYLESIFLNLVGNSIKYRSKNRVPEIFIKSEIIDGKVRLFFQDNGLGIDLEKHGHKLFGLNKVFHRHPEAKGVGLFMVKTQVEALNGTIYATSKVNEGTTFYINFN